MEAVPMKKRILYVEDHPNNRLLVQRILEVDGYEMLTAVDGKAGWHMAVAQKPDLILMDLHLPGELNGLELTEKIKQTSDLNHIPIIALTAFSNDEVERAARAIGCDDFLRKPADIRQIRAILRQYLGEAVVAQTDTAATYTYI
ncbi:MAG: response regulator [Chloroflexi bacterium]|nr:response regulator [Chloroflexota bacterium]